MFSAQLEKALNLINYERGDARGPATPPAKRTEYAERVAGVMVPATAASVFAELLALRSGNLFKDEADLLDALSARLDKPIEWKHSPDFYEVKEGRKNGNIT